MILCVDPGYANYGYIVVNKDQTIIEANVIKTQKTKIKTNRVSNDTAYRIALIVTELTKIIVHHKIKGVLGEMPSSGSKSASAMRAMAIATAVSVSVFTLFRLPTEWTTPALVKQALTGSKTATKQEMMGAACALHNWDIRSKDIHAKNSKKLIRQDLSYWPFGKSMGAGNFEHIADAIGVFEALKTGNLTCMYTNTKSIL